MKHALIVHHTHFNLAKAALMTLLSLNYT